MRVLAIETSCDETALALVNFSCGEEGCDIAIEAEEVASQVALHRPYGGVVPNVAKREHERNLPVLFERISGRAGFDPRSVDTVAVTVGPGLDPALWAGITFAEELHRKRFPHARLVGANHLEGHLYSFLLSDSLKGTKLPLTGDWDLVPFKNVFPAVHLLVSGGHTMLVLMRGVKERTVLGETRDDAVGEAFDKVARLLGLPYPGGPEIERLASAYRKPPSISFPEPMAHSGDYDFSYSGLKTAVRYYLRGHPGADVSEIAHAFQEAAFAPLVLKAKRALEEYGAASLMLSGGVAANHALQETLKELCSDECRFFVAPLRYNTDNATMITIAAYVNRMGYELRSQPNLSL